MFYLRELLNFIKRNIVASFSLVFSIIAISMIVTNYYEIDQIVKNKVPTLENEHYFNVVVENGVNFNSLKRKVEGLPGVKSLVSISDEKIQNTVTKVSSEFALDNEALDAIQSLKSFKLSLREDVSERSINLIREYLTRIAGKNQLILGSVKQKIVDDKLIKSFLVNVKKWPIQMALVFFSLTFIVSFLLVRGRLKQFSYILESYQRRNYVHLKLMLSLFSISLLGSILFSITFLKPNMINLFLIISSLLIIPFVFCRKKGWQLQQ